MKTLPLLLAGWILAVPCADAIAADRFVLPQGAGERDGTNWTNAYDASAGGLQACWDSLSPGDTCHAGPGVYKNATLVVRSGGSPDRPKRLAGSAQAPDQAIFEGDWSIESPDQGSDFLTIKPEADFVRIENLEIRRYRYGIQSTREGRVDHLHLARLHLRDVRIGVELYGDSRCSQGAPGGKGCPEPEKASHVIRLDNVDVTGATKIGIRLRYGVYDAVLKNCDVDLGGKPYDRDPGGDHVGFSLGDGKSGRSSPDRDVTFENCTARNAYTSGGDEYWQGDGFKTEHQSTNVRFLKCRAFDNTDGGFDVKGPGTVLKDCIAARNKRNFRLWNVLNNDAGRARLDNCLGHHAKYWGDKHSMANLHLFGDAVVRNSTFHNTIDTPETVGPFGAYGVLQENRTQKPAFTTIFENCIISRDARSSASSDLVRVAKQTEKTSDIRFVDTVVWDAAHPEKDGAGPDFANATPEFEGGTKDFDSRTYGPAKGYSDPA